MNWTRSLAPLMALLLIWTPYHALAADGDDVTTIDMEPGQVMLELVGQVVDLPTDPSTSNQFGYLSFIKGVEPLFNPDTPPFSETTAMFRFVTQAKTTREITNGPFHIITREGTTRIFFNRCPPCLPPSADFPNPDTPVPAILIQTSTLRQQVIVDTEERTFTVVNVNTITDTRSFTLGDTQFELGQVGQIFRTSLVGRLAPTRVTRGHFSGYAVGVATQER